jgi:hypothetical protein
MNDIQTTALRVTLLTFAVFFLYYASMVFRFTEEDGAQWDLDDVMNLVLATMAGLFAATTAMML